MSSSSEEVDATCSTSAISSSSSGSSAPLSSSASSSTSSSSSGDSFSDARLDAFPPALYDETSMNISARNEEQSTLPGPAGPQLGPPQHLRNYEKIRRFRQGFTPKRDSRVPPSFTAKTTSGFAKKTPLFKRKAQPTDAGNTQYLDEIRANITFVRDCVFAANDSDADVANDRIIPSETRFVQSVDYQEAIRAARQLLEAYKDPGNKLKISIEGVSGLFAELNNIY
ncbi:unnamed protein product [Oikopleura dioica]|uniref:Uncharacterized protein n=1 Tax=Oikopleura dioica TaxID=34765 RepID=E4X280_OIKDI|nr:unnamed protein product [Oikopleura dioica]